MIGATAVIGNDVTLYQGVTLGGTSLQRGIKRHPTLEDGVIVGAGAKILGPIIVGKNARVGSNAVVVGNVDAETTVVGVPAKAIGSKKETIKTGFLAYGTADDAPDPIARALETVVGKVTELQTKLDELEAKTNQSEDQTKLQPPNIEPNKNDP